MDYIFIEEWKKKYRKVEKQYFKTLILVFILFSIFFKVELISQIVIPLFSLSIKHSLQMSSALSHNNSNM